MRKRAHLVGLLLALSSAACATSPVSDINTFADRSGSNSFEVFDRSVNSSALVLPVVHDRQTEGPSCGAHALASVVNYWRGPGTMNGSALYRQTPPQSPSGYSMAELMTLAQANGLLTSAVRLAPEDITRELEHGRPVLVPIRVPSIYVQQYTFIPGGEVPVVDTVRSAVIARAGRVSEMLHTAVVNHYVLVVGYQNDMFVVVEPVMGYRTISFSKLQRYRRAFDNAAIVFSSTRPPASAQAATPSQSQ